MTKDFTSPRRLEPLIQPASQEHAAETTPQNNTLQQETAPPDNMQAHAASKQDDYTISVEQVREHFRGKGLTKSKDTVQRWCRTGDLDCRKLGLLSRYFTTETSLLMLERKLLPDMIAENASHVSSGAANIQLETSADEATRTDAPQHAPVDEPAHSLMQVDEVEDSVARSDVLVKETAGPLHAAAELASLRAENAGLKDQLSEAKENVTFLREEIVSSRGQRGDVVKIAEQMLGTLETIAVGGRLERPRRRASEPTQTTEPMRYDAQNPAVHDV